MAAEKPRNRAVGQWTSWRIRDRLDHQWMVRLVVEKIQPTNRVRVTRWRRKIARATRAESVIPRMVNPAKTRSTRDVASIDGRIGTRVLKYSTAVLAEITAVAR